MRGISEGAVHNRLNITGMRFNNLVVIDSAGNYVSEGGKKYSLWNCKCDCGKEIKALGKNLKNGHTKSCGCITKTRLSKMHSNHKKCGDPVYTTWEAMLQRCSNSNRDNFKHYGGRGITVCERWMKFENFYADMGDRPEGTSIDRIDNNLGYQPNNCRWSTRKEQAKNRRSTSFIEFNGIKKCLSEWASDIGISHVTLLERLQKWTLEKALTTPPKRKTKLPEPPK